MTTQRIYFRGTREDLRRILSQVPRTMAGASDPYGIANGILTRVGVALLSKIQQAFIVKSRGGVGEDGIKWAPLKRETIAQRRTTAGERKALGVVGKRVRGLLTPAQDKRWRALFASEKSRLMAKFGMGSEAASGMAAKLAWGILKSEGAQTKLAVLGSRQVDICRDTSRYFRSLSPGVADRPSGADGQVFETAPGKVIVGTNIPYAARQHAQRPLWPPDGNLPATWWDHLLTTAQRGLLRALALILGSGRL